MSNLQAISMQDTQPVRVINRRAVLNQRTTTASGREGSARRRWVSPFRQFVTPYVGLEAMRQFAEQMDNMP